MARKLKTYVTSIGFYDLAVAAPSMKAAMEAWGVKHNVFHQGMASQTNDPGIVAAAMAKPGMVLRRPVGTEEPFHQDAALPAGFSLPSVKTTASLGAKDRPKAKKRKSRAAEKPKQADDKKHQAAIISFEKARAERERARAKEEAAARRGAEKRASAVEKAEAALDEARKNHHARRRRLTEELDRRLADEDARWNKERRKLEAMLDKARKS
jgi:hypothetical protein